MENRVRASSTQARSLLGLRCARAWSVSRRFCSVSLALVDERR
jgi:hypothetical protein